MALNTKEECVDRLRNFLPDAFHLFRDPNNLEHREMKVPTMTTSLVDDEKHHASAALVSMPSEYEEDEFNASTPLLSQSETD